MQHALRAPMASGGSPSRLMAGRSCSPFVCASSGIGYCGREVADMPHLHAQRGNDRQACFAGDADFLHYPKYPADAACKHDCDLRASGSFHPFSLDCTCRAVAPLRSTTLPLAMYVRMSMNPAPTHSAQSSAIGSVPVTPTSTARRRHAQLGIVRRVPGGANGSGHALGSGLGKPSLIRSSMTSGAGGCPGSSPILALGPTVDRVRRPGRPSPCERCYGASC